jgi:hypothetical protein
MVDSTRQSDVILADARRSLAMQREGGFHRRTRSIGRGSAHLKAQQLAKKVARIVAAVVAIVVGAGIVGAIIGGIGFYGVMAMVLTIVAATWLLASYPKAKVPRRSDLNTADPRKLVARTELWLEHQRPALPPPAVTLVDQIGVQLDALGVQLEHIDPVHPAAVETRKLVGETLPGMVDAYRKIPAHLRGEQRAGATPEQQLVESLGRISGEIDRVTRQLADGALDDLAIQTRYLEYRYGSGEEPSALPGPQRQEP